jgi:DNA-binding CsgD family transcriptional regulator
MLAYRSTAALAAARLGDRAEARRLASEELELARAWGTPRAIGIALRALGLIEEDAGLELLRDAVAMLAPSSAALEHVRAQADLGAALRRANRRAEARPLLAEALDRATRLGALALAERCRTELQATGARPRRVLLTGVDALTASERRVAEMAATGMSNPQIAQALFVTRKTVETHLGSAYRKLGIESRDALPDALAGS